ncbi:hypothetical protein N0V88_001780 [Collariella sp. IMI 366227]|nr:hypothetical protein N0V88_001780 [Collariella sp. IMI 366227]
MSVTEVLNTLSEDAQAHRLNARFQLLDVERNTLQVEITDLKKREVQLSQEQGQLYYENSRLAFAIRAVAQENEIVLTRRRVRLCASNETDDDELYDDIGDELSVSDLSPQRSVFQGRWRSSNYKMLRPNSLHCQPSDEEHFDPTQVHRDYADVAKKLSVFCVPNKAYQKISERLENFVQLAGFSRHEDTEISALQKHALCIVGQTRAVVCHHFLGDLVKFLTYLYLQVVLAEQPLKLADDLF